MRARAAWAAIILSVFGFILEGGIDGHALAVYSGWPSFEPPKLDLLRAPKSVSVGDNTLNIDCHFLGCYGRYFMGSKLSKSRGRIEDSSRPNVANCIPLIYFEQKVFGCRPIIKENMGSTEHVIRGRLPIVFHIKSNHDFTSCRKFDDVAAFDKYISAQLSPGSLFGASYQVSRCEPQENGRKPEQNSEYGSDRPMILMGKSPYTVDIDHERGMTFILLLLAGLCLLVAGALAIRR